MVGGFAIEAKIADTPGGELFLAREPRLKRSVWLHHQRHGESLAPERRARGSARAVVWLDHGRGGDEAWDVYEDVGGGTLEEYARTGLDEWAAIRRPIHELLTELEDEPRELSPDQLWIDRRCNLRVLEFATGSQPSPPLEPDALVCGTVGTLAAGISATPEAGLPEGVHAVLTRIANGELLSRAELRPVFETPDDAAQPVTRWLRFTQLVIAGIEALILLSISLTGLIVVAALEVDPESMVGWRYLGGGAAVLVVGGGISAALAFATRGSIFFSLLQIRVVRLSGDRASRRECALRAIVTWGLLSAALLAIGVVELLGVIVADTVAIPLAGAIVVAGFVHNVWRPDRGFQDRLLGTRLLRAPRPADPH